MEEKKTDVESPVLSEGVEELATCLQGHDRWEEKAEQPLPGPPGRYHPVFLLIHTEPGQAGPQARGRQGWATSSQAGGPDFLLLPKFRATSAV